MNRFTDTEIWNKPWFRRLKPSEKEGWRYIVDHCDNVGVWVPDFEAAEFFVGNPVDWDALLSGCNGNIEVLDNGKWWLVDFPRFQHKDMFSGSQSNACKSYVELLKRHGLYCRFPELFEAFGKPSLSLDKGYKEKERDKEKEREEEKEVLKPYETEFDEAWDIYPKKQGRTAAYKAYVARRRGGVSHDTMLAATKVYAQQVDGEQQKYIKLGSTFYGPNTDWEDYTNGHKKTSFQPEVPKVCEQCGEPYNPGLDSCPRCPI